MTGSLTKALASFIPRPAKQVKLENEKTLTFALGPNPDAGPTDAVAAFTVSAKSLAWRML